MTIVSCHAILVTVPNTREQNKYNFEEKTMKRISWPLETPRGPNLTRGQDGDQRPAGLEVIVCQLDYEIYTFLLCLPNVGTLATSVYIQYNEYIHTIYTCIHRSTYILSYIHRIQVTRVKEPLTLDLAMLTGLLRYKKSSK